MYWYWIALGFLLVAVLITFAVYVTRLNQGLRRTRVELENSRMDLELKVSERTAERKISMKNWKGK